jgi:P27 family predicted phage terminase small subunit
VLLKTPAGYVQPSPWLAIASKQLELMAKFMAELGLTPSARSRLAIRMPTGPKPWEWSGDEDPAERYLG